MIFKCSSYYFQSITGCFYRFCMMRNTSKIQLNISKRNINFHSQNRSKEKIYGECKLNNIKQLTRSYEYNIFFDRMIDINVCIIGGGLSSVYTAILLKQSRLIKDIHLVDLSGTLAGTVLDASHIDTSICIKYFTKKMIREALTKTNIVALMDESDLNIHKDPYVQFNSCSKYIHQIIEDIITICPMALVAIFTKPVTATLSMISEIYKHAGKWDPNRLIGSASMEIMRIETITGNILDLNPASISIPIAGGADLDTVVPLLSCAKPIDGFITAHNSTLVELFQATEQEKTHSNVKKFALLDGNAAVKLILTLASGLSGIDNIYACAFVRSNVLPVCRFFTSQLQFGLRGIKENFGLPKVSPLEINMIEKAIPIINEYVEMGVKAANSKEIKS